MSSTIGDASIEEHRLLSARASHANLPSRPNMPIVLKTDATVTAPSGWTYEDPLRGTVFWEAERHTKDTVNGDQPVIAQDTRHSISSSLSNVGTNMLPSAPPDYGRPFKVTWLSTKAVPFARLHGMRNPWNGNRDVKIARDGTEIEPTVGRKLLSIFYQP